MNLTGFTWTPTLILFIMSFTEAPTQNIPPVAGEGEVQRIAVLPRYRRLGLGRKMMDAMLTYASQCRVTAVSLEVREGNHPARRLYESYGFAAEAVRRDYYRNPTEDAVIMWKRDFAAV